VRSSHLRLRHLEAQSPGDRLRVAYAISRKVGPAVVRNRIRRRIRGLLEEHRAAGLELPGGAMMFIVFPSARDLTYEELRTQVTDVVNKVNDLKRSNDERSLKNQGSASS
jgi:ribonuclease P protein component